MLMPGDPKYQHGEAFCLMTYRAEDDPSDVEVIWNSRDGVTPFIMTNRNGRLAKHVAWYDDECRPDHKPQVGDRIWVDLTAERAEQIAAERTDHYWNDEANAMYGAARAMYSSQEEMQSVLARGLLEEVEHGAPDLVEVTPEMVQANGWEITPVDRATDALKALPSAQRRDRWGYELSDDSLRELATWVLAQDLGQRMDGLIELLAIAMLTREAPLVCGAVDTPAEDDHLEALLRAVMDAVVRDRA